MILNRNLFQVQSSRNFPNWLRVRDFIWISIINLHNTADLKVKLAVLEVVSRLYSTILSYDTGAKKLSAAGWLWQAIKVHDYTRLLRALLHCYIGHWPRRDCQADKKWWHSLPLSSSLASLTLGRENKKEAESRLPKMEVSDFMILVSATGPLGLWTY